MNDNRILFYVNSRSFPSLQGSRRLICLSVLVLTIVYRDKVFDCIISILFLFPFCFIFANHDDHNKKKLYSYFFKISNIEKIY